MIDLKLDQNADLVFEDDLQAIADVEEVKQAVVLTLRTCKGEFFADKDVGLDWEYVVGKGYNEQYAAANITDAIMEDPRVTAVNDIELTVLPNRTLKVEVQFTIDNTIQTGMEVAVVA